LSLPGFFSIPPLDVSTLVQRVADRHLARTVSAAVPKDPNAANGILLSTLQARKQVEAAKTSLEAALRALPTDKAIPAILKSLEKVFKDFDRDIEVARKIIRTDSKTSLSEPLKKLSAAITRGIKAQLVDPKNLKVIPWKERGDLMIVWRVTDPGVPNHNKKAEVSIVESQGHILLRRGYNTDPVKSPKQVVEAFLDQLQGWPGVKGEENKNAIRKIHAEQIATALNLALRRMGGYDLNKAEISRNLREVEGAYRSDLPKEGAYETGEYEYQRMVENEIGAFRKVLDAALKPYMKDIKDIRVDDGEKSWIYASIELK